MNKSLIIPNISNPTFPLLAYKEDVSRKTTITHKIGIRTVIDAAAQLSGADRIYLRHNTNTAIPSHQLLVLLPEESLMSIPETRAVVKQLLVQNNQPYYCTVLSAAQAAQFITKGNMFLYLTCAPKNLVYVKEGLTTDLQPKVLRAAAIEKATSAYKSWMFKSASFLENAEINYRKQEYSFAAYLLHQSVEMNFCALEHALLGNDQCTHRIKAHQHVLGCYFPELANIFRHSEQQERKLLMLFEKSYLGYRYKQDYQVEKEEYEQMYTMAAELRQAGVTSFNTIMNALALSLPTVTDYIFNKDPTS